MECPRCPTENPSNAKFCGSCGTELLRTTSSLPPHPVQHSNIATKFRAVFSEARPRALLVLLLAGFVVLAGTILRNYVFIQSSGNTAESQRNLREPGTGEITQRPSLSVITPTDSLPSGEWTVIGGPSCDSGTAPIDLTQYATVSAPSTAPPGVDSAGNAVSYPSDNMFDDDPATAWRMKGDGRGSTIHIAFDRDVLLCEMGIINGYAKIDPSSNVLRYYEGRRIQKITWQAHGTIASFTLPETTRVTSNRFIPGAATKSILLTIDKTSRPGSTKPQHDYTAISELTFKGFTQ